MLQTLLRLLLTPIAFAQKWQRDKCQNERAGFFRRTSEHGADAATSAAAETSYNQNDIRTFACIGVHELIFDFRGQSIAESIERLQRFATEVVPRVDS